MPTDLSLTLAPVPSSGGIARAAVREHFAGLLRKATFADLELVVSELVTNAVEHGRGTIRVEVTHTDHEIRGSVTDRGSGFAYEPRELSRTDDRGRGLAIVNALVTRWGIRHGSTQVWFAISLRGT
jgi:anti-sigma regulatory factor (Ser/Thr protein kinase)